MLDYEVLCQSIADWRAGRRPSVPPPMSDARSSHGYAAPAPASVEEVDSGLLEDDELLDAEGGGAQQPYDSTSMYGAPSSHDTLPGPRTADVDVDVE